MEWVRRDFIRNDRKWNGEETEWIGMKWNGEETAEIGNHWTGIDILTKILRRQTL